MKPAGRIEPEGISEDPSIAIEQLMHTYGTAVLRTAYFYLRDRHLAEDVSQEVFIRAYRSWSGFRGDSSVKTWLARITVNVCRDKTGVKSYAEQPTDPVLIPANDHAPNVEDEVLDRLSGAAIAQHVLRLPKSYQEVVYLYYYLELNTREIAEATSTSEGTVRGRLHRARQQLEDAIRKEEGLP